ncbi:AfsR/SARP family transcriptional regulator [Streptacidiphilus sp. ASG 303]|uniref:AfsR/SARP family transcriptional regulator n=1 Tax=Streptacidiphilus sp. ASG 303 TaxID=2896847 RepID=UPI001E5FA263|nr:AfsR/SARP family transcriptional regulator [Streptacidiphilus sp. ASG 303]MCD0486338.1 AfsR/SARP family transcriptional regulator [Streptacidiphilus sp. ASG 303]
MDIKVLGPLRAEVHGRSIVPSAGKPRQILALLAVYANQILPVPALMEEVWGADMPRSALTTLQTYILQLRRLLAAAYGPDPLHGPKDVLATRHGGYLLEVQPGAVDVHEYDRLVAAGRAAADRGEDEAASVLYREALSVWHGPALVDVKAGPLLEIERVRLEESRLGALERRIDADLRLGRHDELLSELTALTARHPLHEGLHAQCMVALYRSGRQWRALEIYQGLRGCLAEELGLDPSARLQRLHHAILAGDPALEAGDRSRRPILDLFAA